MQTIGKTLALQSCSCDSCRARVIANEPAPKVRAPSIAPECIHWYLWCGRARAPRRAHTSPSLFLPDRLPQVPATIALTGHSARKLARSRLRSLDWVIGAGSKAQNTAGLPRNHASIRHPVLTWTLTSPLGFDCWQDAAEKGHVQPKEGCAGAAGSVEADRVQQQQRGRQREAQACAGACECAFAFNRRSAGRCIAGRAAQGQREGSSIARGGC